MKIAVAMSGGVDSSMAAVLLKEQGHDVIGITLKLVPDSCVTADGIPLGRKLIDDARKIADAFNFEHHVLDLQDDFNDIVVDPFCNEYLKGRTPNPCVRCDARIKFARLHDYARDLECQKVATGHYAVLGRSDSGRYFIGRGSDITRDQSYFLYMVTQEILARILFPLGELTKDEVRSMAEEHGLHVAGKPDSQEICFIPDDRYAEFIESKTGKIPPRGDIVDKNGKVLGRHKGIHRYTIGQRRGLGISDKEPLYVTAIDGDNNRLIAGYRSELDTAALLAGDIHYMKETDLTGKNVLVKNRSTQSPVEARLEKHDDGILVIFKDPQDGISPGQSSVFYNEKMEILGGGIIKTGFPEVP